MCKALILNLVIAVALIGKSHALTCNIVQAITTPGDIQFSAQSSGGFCNEYILGPVSSPQTFLVMFGKVDASCSAGDKLTVYSADRTQVLYDQCSPIVGQQSGYVVFQQTSYVFLRLSTSQSLLLSIALSFYNLAPPGTLTTTTTQAGSTLFPTLSTAASTTKLTTLSTQAVTTATTTAGLTADCGNPYYPPNESILRIVGGIETVKNSWPWQVYVTDGSFMCGGSLISNNYVVTAAHCLEGVSPSTLSVYLGTHTLNRMEATTVKKSVSAKFVYPTYAGSRGLWDNDIALLKLSTPVTFTNEIRPVCLPNQGENLAIPGATGYVTGWGKTSGTGSVSNVLKQTSLAVNNLNACGLSNQNNMICAGQFSPTVHDSCGGDSGGPFVIKKGSSFVLSGIVSWGSDSCSGDGVYTKVSNYVNWIKSTMAASP